MRASDLEAIVFGIVNRVTKMGGASKSEDAKTVDGSSCTSERVPTLVITDNRLSQHDGNNSMDMLASFASLISWADHQNRDAGMPKPKPALFYSLATDASSDCLKSVNCNAQFCNAAIEPMTVGKASRRGEIPTTTRSVAVQTFESRCDLRGENGVAVISQNTHSLLDAEKTQEPAENVFSARLRQGASATFEPRVDPGMSYETLGNAVSEDNPPPTGSPDYSYIGLPPLWSSCIPLPLYATTPIFTYLGDSCLSMPAINFPFSQFSPRLTETGVKIDEITSALDNVRKSEVSLNSYLTCMSDFEEKQPAEEAKITVDRNTEDTQTIVSTEREADSDTTLLNMFAVVKMVSKSIQTDPLFGPLEPLKQGKPLEKKGGLLAMSPPPPLRRRPRPAKSNIPIPKTAIMSVLTEPRSSKSIVAALSKDAVHRGNQNPLKEVAKEKLEEILSELLIDHAMTDLKRIKSLWDYRKLGLLKQEDTANSPLSLADVRNAVLTAVKSPEKTKAKDQDDTPAAKVSALRETVSEQSVSTFTVGRTHSEPTSLNSVNMLTADSSTYLSSSRTTFDSHTTQDLASNTCYTSSLRSDVKSCDQESVATKASSDGTLNMDVPKSNMTQSSTFCTNGIGWMSHAQTSSPYSPRAALCTCNRTVSEVEMYNRMTENIPSDSPVCTCGLDALYNTANSGQPQSYSSMCHVSYDTHMLARQTAEQAYDAALDEHAAQMRRRNLYTQMRDTPQFVQQVATRSICSGSEIRLTHQAEPNACAGPSYPNVRYMALGSGIDSNGDRRSSSQCSYTDWLSTSGTGETRP